LQAVTSNTRPLCRSIYEIDLQQEQEPTTILYHIVTHLRLMVLISEQKTRATSPCRIQSRSPVLRSTALRTRRKSRPLSVRPTPSSMEIRGADRWYGGATGVPWPRGRRDGRVDDNTPRSPPLLRPRQWPPRWWPCAGAASLLLY
jgi:hypothetical protein